MKDRGIWRWAPLVVIAVVAGLFAAFNSGERVALNLGFTMLYRLPLVPLVFLAFLAGMATMFLVGLRQDLRVRRALREAGLGDAGRSAVGPAPPRPDPSSEVSRVPAGAGDSYPTRAPVDRVYEEERIPVRDVPRSTDPRGGAEQPPPPPIQDVESRAADDPPHLHRPPREPTNDPP